jgi:hypothetical protein
MIVKMSGPAKEYLSEERDTRMSVDEMFERGAPEVPPGQNWAVLSVLTPLRYGELDPKYTTNASGFTNVSPCDKMAIAIHGVFLTNAEALEYIERIQKLGYNAFDLFVVKMNAFAPYPPPRDGSSIEVHTAQEELKGVYFQNKEVIEQGRKLLKERVERDKAVIEEHNEKLRAGKESTPAIEEIVEEVEAMTEEELEAELKRLNSEWELLEEEVENVIPTERENAKARLRERLRVMRRARQRKWDAKQPKGLTPQQSASARSALTKKEAAARGELGNTQVHRGPDGTPQAYSFIRDGVKYTLKRRKE